MIMNTDDMLIAYSDNARDLVDSFEKKLNNSFEATQRSQIEHYMGMHVLYDQQKGILILDARRHVHGFINHMGLDPNLDVGVSTPLDPHEVYSTIHTKFNRKQIHLPRLMSSLETRYGKLTAS